MERQRKTSVGRFAAHSVSSGGHTLNALNASTTAQPDVAKLATIPFSICSKTAFNHRQRAPVVAGRFTPVGGLLTAQPPIVHLSIDYHT